MLRGLAAAAAAQTAVLHGVMLIIELACCQLLLA